MEFLESIAEDTLKVKVGEMRPQAPLNVLKTLAAVFALVLALLAVLAAGEKLMVDRAEALRTEALKSAVQVRAQGAALAFAKALNEDWEETKWTAAQIAEATDAERQQLIQAIVSDGSRVRWAGFANTEGIVIHGSGGLLVGQDVSARPWFTQGMRRPFAGDAHEALLLQRFLGKPSAEPLRFLDLAVPVTAQDGSVAGVLGVHIDVRWAQNYLRDLSSTLGIDLILVDRSGQVSISSFDEQEHALPLDMAALSTETAKLFEWPDGQSYFTALVPQIGVEDMPSFGWRLLARIDPHSLPNLTVPANQLAQLLQAGTESQSLRSVFVVLALFAGLLGGLALLFSYRAQEASAQASMANRKLASSEQRFLALFGSASLPIAVVRGETYQTVNEAAARLLGYERASDLEGKTFMEVSPEIQADGQKSTDKIPAIESQLARSGSARFDWSHLKADGTLILLDIILTVVQSETGRDVFAVWTDVTARRKAEETIRTYQTALEHAVTERTEELQKAYADLRVAKNESDQLAKLRSDFLATMSHEIRGPLNSLIGFVELAQEDGSVQQRTSFLTKALQAGQHLAHIVDDVLDLTRAEAGRIELEDVEFDLVDFAYATLEALEPAVRDKPIDLIFDVAPDLPQRINADPLRLRQVLMNYLTNAGKFTASGEICLSVRTIQRDGQKFFRFAVQDTGIGLRPDQRDRLFQNFSQADISIARLYGGSGLGLAICQQLATLMNGKVGVDSAEGEGSCFWFDLPYADHVPLQPSAPKLPVGAGKTVWLGISSERRRAVMKAWLTAEGFHVEEFGSSAPASPDAIVLHDVAFEEATPWLDRVPPERRFAVRSSRAETHLDPAKTIRTPVHPRRLIALIAPRRTKGDEAQRANQQPVNYARRFRVLVADDDGLNRDLACSRLEKLGLTVRTAVNGTEALQAVLEEPFDLILMDHQMPIIDGIEATRRIRSLPSSRSQTPIVGISGSDRPEVRRACMEAGMNEFLLKPLSNPKLTIVLAQFLPT